MAEEVAEDTEKIIIIPKPGAGSVKYSFRLRIPQAADAMEIHRTLCLLCEAFGRMKESGGGLRDILRGTAAECGFDPKDPTQKAILAAFLDWGREGFRKFAKEVKPDGPI